MCLVCSPMLCGFDLLKFPFGFISSNLKSCEMMKLQVVCTNSTTTSVIIIELLKVVWDERMFDLLGQAA